jgi:hypothetical protein
MEGSLEKEASEATSFGVGGSFPSGFLLSLSVCFFFIFVRPSRKEQVNAAAEGREVVSWERGQKSPKAQPVTGKTTTKQVKIWQAFRWRGEAENRSQYGTEQ